MAKKRPATRMVLLQAAEGLTSDAEAYLKTTPIPAALETALDELLQKCLDGRTEPPSIAELAEMLKAAAAKNRAAAASTDEAPPVA